jgi:hypothetical protein
MKITNYKTSTIKAFIITAVASLCACVIPEASAASFKMETVVPGYTGYVLVRPELRYVLGGRVRWNSTLRCFETDRVSRGEKLRVTINPSTASERCLNIAIAGVTSSNGFAAFNLVTIPYVENRFGVSTNTSFDNVEVRAYTTSGLYSVRLPIGKRS